MSEDEVSRAHTIRNAAAATLANLEHLVSIFRLERPEAPFLEHATEQTRRDALRSLEGADRAVRQLVKALREAPST